MKKLLMTTALLIWIGAPAIAQTGSGGSSTAVKDRPTPQAPVGHRQPKLSDLPAESQNAATTTERSARDRELDGKLQICRGC